MILSDAEIKRQLSERRLIIEPLSDEQISPNGVDLRVGNEYVRLLSGLAYKSETFSEVSRILIQPNERVLLSTLERVEMPSDVVGLVNLRSSYARLGLTIPPTVIDAGYRGKLTFLVSGSSFPVELKVGERFWHVVFVQSRPSEKAYAGKYQESKGIKEYVPD